MQYSSLSKLIAQLKSSPRVKGIFLAGATALKPSPSSDIDLIVLLDKNSEGMKAVYTAVEHRFADIFFFDVAFVQRLKAKREVSGNGVDGMFVRWLAAGTIAYDPLNLLRETKEKISERPPTQKISNMEKRDAWVKVNYNFIANSRYYRSRNARYHTALEFRLLYSVIELVTAYFLFRNIPWRGEKAAVRYFTEHDQEFLEIFRKYAASASLAEKMKRYRALFAKVFFGGYARWENGFVIPISNNHNQFDPALLRFWNGLIGNGA